MKRKDRKQAKAGESRPAAQGVPWPARVSLPALGAGFALVLLVVIFYLPATRCGYIWDDDTYVRDNPVLRSVSGLGKIWFDLTASPQYYPLVYSSYWLEFRLWGAAPRGYHVVNILLHAGVAVLLWRVLRYVRVPGAWAAAALFALHPVHVESVTWITERKNVLSGVLYLGAALAYLHYALPGEGRVARGRGRWLYALALVLFIGALLSKTVTCTLPAVLVLVLWWRRGRLRWRDWLALAPFFVLGIAAGLLTRWVEKYYTGAAGAEWTFSFVERCLIAGRALWFYAGKLLWPHPLIFIYPRWAIDAGAWVQYVFPIAAVAVLVALWLLRGRVGRGPLVGALCFAGTLFPALGFFDVYFMRYSFVADHWQYLASAALLAVFAGAGATLAARCGARGRAVAGGVLAVALLVLGGLTSRQSWAYTDLEGLWRDTLRKNPDAWMAHNNLGSVLQRSGRLDEARAAYTRALELNPHFAQAHANLGALARLKGQLDEARQHYEEALRIDPQYPTAHYNLGNLYKDQGRYAEAQEAYRRALVAAPADAQAHVNLGWVLMTLNDNDAAAEHFRAALRIQPQLAPAHLNLGIIQENRGDAAAALASYTAAVRSDPNMAQAHYRRGVALLRQNQLEAAGAALRTALRLQPNYLEAQAALKSVELQQGQRPQ